MGPELLAFALVSSTIVQAATSGSRPTPPPVVAGPEPPTLADPAIAAARRRQLKSTAGKGRSGTIISGKGRNQTLETENQTLLGGAGGR